jgi:hypothetical protein
MKKYGGCMKKILIILTIAFIFASCDEGPKGPDGLDGERGRDGSSVAIIGRFDTEAELNENGQEGTSIFDGMEYINAYFVGGDLYVWDDLNQKWVNVGSILGEVGDKGPLGPVGPPGSDAPLNGITVTFDMNGGTGYAPSIVLISGQRTYAPRGIVKKVVDFPVVGLFRTDAQYTVEWETQDGELWNFDTPVTESMTLKARWTAPASRAATPWVSSANNVVINAAVYLNNSNNTSGANADLDWVLYLDSDVTTNIMAYNGNAPISFNLTILSIDNSERKVSLATNGSLINLNSNVDGNVRITISENITFVGRSQFTGGNNTAPLITVTRGQFTMLEGSKIISNATTGDCAGVRVAENGKFIMRGGQMTGNAIVDDTTANAGSRGTAVYLDGGSIFEMYGGSISLGSSITGNVASVFVGTGSRITVLGDASLDSVTLYATNTTNGGRLTLTDGWTGSINKLNLSGNAAVATVVGYWYNATLASSQVVVAPAGDYLLVTGDVDKITLGDFIGNNGVQAITSTYEFNFDAWALKLQAQ